MKARVRRGISVTAVIAIALHTILWGVVAPSQAAGAPDPFSIICHSDAGAGPSDQAPDQTHLLPAHACDHCNLCSAAAPPTVDAALLGQLGPADVLLVLRPGNFARRDLAAAYSHFARGPPSFA
jgi:hypothetical protein